tara:strand:+ start:1229 stop:1387 length:159 start_codon:yes stop_codon:yes gene_type:complete
MKKTAVEWLIEQFRKNGYIGRQDELQAKEMEKEQIKNSFNNGYLNHKTNSEQ